MPIEVEGPDGSVIEFPDGTTTSVMQRAMADKFGSPQTTAPKPGKVAVGKPAAPKSSALRPDDAKAELDRSSALLEQKIAKLPPKYQQMARDKFFADPRVETLRVASAKKVAPAPTARERGRKMAETRSPVGKFLDDYAGGNFLKALSAGVDRSMFGLPERAAAAVVAPFSDKDYGEVLEEMRGSTDRDMDRSTTGNILGQIAGSVMGGGAAGAGVRGAGRVLATRGGGRLVQAAGRALEGAATVKQGQRVANAAKIVAGGATAGAAQAAGEGSDVKTGAAVGAAGAAILPPLVRGMGFLARPAADFLRLSKAPQLLRRFTTASADDIARAADDYRATTGSEPTMFELLPLADRNKLAKSVVGRTPATQEKAAAAVRRRVANVGDELAQTARTATGPRRQSINEQMASDIETAAGQAPNRGVLPGGYGADRSAADMKQFQADEARAIMAPHEDTVVSDDLKQLFPTSLHRDPATGEVREVFSDPEVVDAINSAAGSLKLRPKVGTDSADIEGLTANDATRILKRLAKIDPGAPNKPAAMRAESIIMDHMDRHFPQVSEAVTKMRASYARRARMVEGMAEGGRTRTRESIPVESSQQARVVRNAFETPEGEAGRFLGQSNALQRELGGTTQDALRSAQGIAESGQTQAALRANLGTGEAARIIGAADAQSQSVRNLGSLSKEKGDVADSLGMEDIGRMVLALNPASMPTTKLFAISRLTTLTHLPESRAKEIVDMMFSQNPTITNRAISLLKRAGPEGNAALASIGRGLAQQAQSGVDAMPQSEMSPIPQAGDGLEGSVTDTGEYEEPAAEEPEDGVEEFGDYQEMLDDQMEKEDPELVDLWMRQTHQESGRKQFGADGEPLRSSAGAVGVAQVMPTTAPEAARLAGLEWDEDAYKNDPAYNELIGLAYMKEMLRQFDGDVELALAAYNAGPGAVRKAGNRVPRIAETEDYVDRIMAGG